MTRDEAIKALTQKTNPMMQYEALDMAIKALNEPEIVRCKDCEYWDLGSPMATVIPTPCRCRLRREDYGMTAEDFCSYGMRKEKTDE